jgi:hypothetical protein
MDRRRKKGRKRTGATGKKRASARRATGASTGAVTGPEASPQPVETPNRLSEATVTDEQTAAPADESAQLKQDVAAALAGAPVEEALPPGEGEPAPAAQPTEAEVLAGYVIVSTALIEAGAGAIAPAWAITPEETGKLALAMSQAALLWFPDHIIPPKYMALVVIAGVSFEIINARREPSGKFRPLRVAQPPAIEQQGQQPPAT